MAFRDSYDAAMSIATKPMRDQESLITANKSTLPVLKQLLKGADASYIKGGRILPFHLRITNPLRLEDVFGRGRIPLYNIVAQLQRLQLVSEQRSKQISDMEPLGAAMDAVMDAIELAGFDGVVYRNEIEGEGNSWIAFHPGQIMSAADTEEAPTAKDANILRQFAGPRAETANVASLAQARARIAAGEDGELVRQETGWHQGADQHWRFEVSDAGASLRPSGEWRAQERLLRIKLYWAEQELEAAKKVKGDRLKEARKAVQAAQSALNERTLRGLSVADILDHPALFEAYPDVADIRVKLDDSLPTGSGCFEPRGMNYKPEITMSIVDVDLKVFTSSLLHEIQHAIQHVEGFARGGSPEGMHQFTIEHSRAAIEAEYGDLPSYQAALAAGRLDEWVMTAMQATGRGLSPYQAYQRLAGEIEARNTQTRAGLDDAQRRATPPSATADIPDSQAIVRPEDKVSASRLVAPPRRPAAGPAPRGQDGKGSGQPHRGQIFLPKDITQAASVISLLQSADASTFLHEAGHFFLQVMAHMASQPDAPQAICEDVEITLQWFGVQDLPAWNSMTLQQQAPHHEKFARGFEAYLREGRAPEQGLQRIFQRFGTWLQGIYRQASQLDVSLTDEMRGVYARLLSVQAQDQRQVRAQADARDSLMTPPARKAESDRLVGSGQDLVLAQSGFDDEMQDDEQDEGGAPAAPRG